MKKLGYTMAHIWACPPSEGDDYIFHSHPAEQKIPKPKRLQVNVWFLSERSTRFRKRMIVMFLFLSSDNDRTILVFIVFDIIFQ